ncbi:MAG: hypothetical protein GY789_04025 [Hyphomicrobiales bacterium]|nr:hypothetical protein [Hyphomicrobiales bacterium]MCP4998427.1 hypothetical protein [Hyphomicrobiales bacterium]
MGHEIFRQQEQPKEDFDALEPQNITTTGLEIGIDLQSAAVELTEEEFSQSLAIASDIIKRLSSDFPNADMRVLCVLSPASTYDFEDELIATSSKGFGLCQNHQCFQFEEKCQNSRRIGGSLRSDRCLPIL